LGAEEVLKMNGILIYAQVLEPSKELENHNLKSSLLV
jgi:hypothetical protein